MSVVYCAKYQEGKQGSCLKDKDERNTLLRLTITSKTYVRFFLFGYREKEMR